MALWHETWRWPDALGSAQGDDSAFWNLTGPLRQALKRHAAGRGGFVSEGGGESVGLPDALVLSFHLANCPDCRELEQQLDLLGAQRLGSRGQLRLKAICGAQGEEHVGQVRVGDTEFRLPGYPVLLFFTVHPPTPRRMGRPVMRSDPASMEALRDFLQDEEEMAEGFEPPLCMLHFHAMGVGCAGSDPISWWGHLGEGRSCWNAETEDSTLKVSIFGEVVRTLSLANRFHMDFKTRL